MQKLTYTYLDDDFDQTFEIDLFKSEQENLNSILEQFYKAEGSIKMNSAIQKQIGPWYLIMIFVGVFLFLMIIISAISSSSALGFLFAILISPLVAFLAQTKLILPYFSKDFKKKRVLLIENHFYNFIQNPKHLSQARYSKAINALEIEENILRKYLNEKERWSTIDISQNQLISSQEQTKITAMITSIDKEIENHKLLVEFAKAWKSKVHILNQYNKSLFNLSKINKERDEFKTKAKTVEEVNENDQYLLTAESELREIEEIYHLISQEIAEEDKAELIQKVKKLLHKD